MAKVVLPRLSSGYLSAEALNSALADIEVAFENTLSRDGDVPNQLEADLDLNGHSLLNAGFSTSPDRVLSYAEMINYVATQAAGIVVQSVERQVATAGQTEFTLTTIAYAPGSHNLSVYVNGIRRFSDTFSETSSSIVTFSPGLTVGDKVDFVNNEFMGTVELPAHSHVWEQITGAPVFTTRWPAYSEVTGKPATFAPAAHNQDASTITSGRLADARRGAYVQSTQPAGLGAGDVGVLWFW